MSRTAYTVNTTAGLVAPLADNGGPTLTVALLPFSPAIDAANTAAAPSTDQRGFPRPYGPAADIGADEYQGCWPPILRAASPLGPSGPIVLQLAGLSNALVRLLASTTLANWVPIATNQFGADGFLTFRVPLTADRQRFFRLVSP